jgi:radical SAM superfamily enzyme YgiQ (UPF0313 family)
MDNQTEDDIRRLIDFLLEINLDLAEFTVMTPFPHTKAWDDLVREKRIFNFDWNDYNAGRVVFKPKHMTPEKLQDLYFFAWEEFYRHESQEQKMFKLIMKVIEREMNQGTYRSPKKEMADRSFGKEIKR